MSFQTPKINWTPADGCSCDDLNRIEGNTSDLDQRASTNTTTLSNIKPGAILYLYNNAWGGF